MNATALRILTTEFSEQCTIKEKEFAALILAASQVPEGSRLRVWEDNRNVVSLTTKKTALAWGKPSETLLGFWRKQKVFHALEYIKSSENVADMMTREDRFQEFKGKYGGFKIGKVDMGVLKVSDLKNWKC